MALSKFKYVPSKDTGVNPDKSITAYGFVFPAGKEVEVPDGVAAKLRTKSGREGDELVEVTVGAPKTDADLQREKEAKASKDAKPEKLSSEDIETLKEKAARDDARVGKLQEDARLGR